jgi:hypothetical protein
MNLGIFSADNAVPIRVNRVVYATAGTFTYNKPANLIAVDVEVEGGGGGAGDDIGPSGGAAGGYARRLIAASLLPASVPVVVGAAGSVGNPGTAGGTTSFGSLLSGTGGNPGARSSTSPMTGGSGTGGDTNRVGASGGVGILVGCTNFQGHGGTGLISRGGGGGNGSASGFAGAVIITEYLKGAA